MIESYKKLVDAFKKNNRSLQVTTVIDYDDKYLLIEAVEDTTQRDYNDPLYAVEKKTGKVSHFSPAFDFEKFFDALENRIIYSALV